MIDRALRSLAVFLVCILPAVAASCFAAYVFTRRVNDVMANVSAALDVLENDKTNADVKVVTGIDDKELEKYLGEVRSRKVFAGQRADIETYRRNAVKAVWAFLAALTILPFGFVAARLSANEFSAPGAWSASLSQAHRSFAMKALLATVLAWSWLYILNARGLGASVILGFVGEQKVVTGSSLPSMIDNGFALPPLLSAALGFYLYVAGYLFNRARQGDVKSTRVYGVLFRKALFTAGITVIFATVAGAQAAIVGFLIGFIPSSWVDILKAVGAKSLDSVGDPTASLRKLPGISRGEIARLEEEGIDSIAALMSFSASDLKQLLPIAPVTIDTWYDVAILINVVGLERYQKLEPYCLTARNFVKESVSEAFQKSIREGAQIYNAEEIAGILKSFLKRHLEEGPGSASTLPVDSPAPDADGGR